MPVRPHLILDIDGVLQAPNMKYGFERMVTVRERIPYEDVHPALRPRVRYTELPDWLSARRDAPTHVTFATPVRTSTKLLGDLADLGLNVVMLTTWLEHDSVDQFFAQSGGAPFAYSKLSFPGRPADDPPRRDSLPLESRPDSPRAFPGPAAVHLGG